jgi:hypothetical protein
LDAEERAKRKQFLAKLNQAVELAVPLMDTFSQGYREYDELAALGKITTLRQVAKVEKIGWSVGDLGGPQEAIGDALVQIAEIYWSRYPITAADEELAQERIEELERMTKIRSRLIDEERGKREQQAILNPPLA